MTDEKIIRISRPHGQYEAYRSEIDAAVARVLNSGNYILGEEVEGLEAEFASYIGVKYGVGVGCGTDALSLALLAIGAGHGDEIIIPSMTSVATAMAIYAVGADPVLADVNEESGLITSLNVEPLVSNKTKAIIPVHLYGSGCNMGELMEFAQFHTLPLIEDCAQAHGATRNNQKIGSFGVAGCFSFYPTKNLGAFGDGGIIVTNDFSVSSKLRGLRQYGFSSSQKSSMVGRCSRLDELQASILRVKLRHLEIMNNNRSLIAKRYTSAFKSLPIICPKQEQHCQHVFHQYVVRVSDRDKLRAFLHKKNIETAIHFPLPIHDQPFWRNASNKIGNFPVTDNLVSQILSIPMDPYMSEEEQGSVIAAIEQYYD